MLFVDRLLDREVGRRVATCVSISETVMYSSR